MSWATILMALISAVGALSKYLSDRQLLQLEDAAVAAKELQRIKDAITAGDSVDVSADGLRRHDAHERPD